jgi:hypothetical protein
MSNLFYEATRVFMDGRLDRMFSAPVGRGRSAHGRLDQNPQIVKGVITASRRGESVQNIAKRVGISTSSVIKVRRLYRDQWAEAKGVKA